MKIFLPYALILAALPLSARTLSPEEALSRASDTTGKHLAAPLTETTDAKLAFTQISKNTDNPTIYVFNKPSEKGYIIVSADDIAIPVLGFSDSGTFDAENIPDNLRWWLEEYSREITYASENNITEKAYSIDLGGMNKISRNPISPMLSTKWNQDAPYNNLCPDINGKKTYTGCVATAMAQVMNYCKWPEKGNGSHSYEWEYTTGNKKTLSMDFSSTTFDWANMLDSYTNGNYNSSQATAVATLMKACGYSVNMGYGTSESGAVTLLVGQSLINYFNYDSKINAQLKKYYTSCDWESLIYDNLKNVGPVLYAGKSNQGGHAFVCDGYSSDGYFHFNWGWSGMSDGYFKLSALDPESQGIGGSSSGYNVNQQVILGIQKSQGGTAPSGVSLYTDEQLSFTLSSGTLKSIPCFNYSYYSGPASIGYKLEGTAGNVQYIKTNGYLANIPFLSGIGNYSAKLPTNLSNGNYKVYLVYSDKQNPSNSDWKLVKTPVTSRQYGTLTVSNGNYSISTEAINQIKIEDLTLKSPLYANKACKISFKISNPNDISVAKTLAICALNSSASIIGQTPVFYIELEPNEEKVIESDYIISYSSNISTQNGYLVIGNVESNKLNILDDITVTINAKPLNTSLRSTLWNVVDSKNVDKDNIQIEATISGTAGFYANNIYALIFNYPNPTTNIALFYSPLQYIENGKSVSFSFKGSFPQGEAGKSYLVAPFMITDNNQLSQIQPANAIFTLSEQSGVENIASDSIDDISLSVAPDRSTISITSPVEITSANIFTVSGVNISTPTIPSGLSFNVDISTLNPGMYIIRISTEKGNRTFKFIR